MGTEKRKSQGLSPGAPQYFKVREIWRQKGNPGRKKSQKSVMFRDQMLLGVQSQEPQ